MISDLTASELATATTLSHSGPHRTVTAAEQQAALKSHLAGILRFFDTGSRVIYVDYPLHSNFGDLWIDFGAQQFLADQNVPVWRRYSYSDFPGELSGVRPDDTFLCHGGGNFGDVWPLHQAFREKLLAKYPRNRVIFLPQSLEFSNTQLQRECFARLRKHGNLHIFVRDLHSLETLHAAGLKASTVMPDMAHGAWRPELFESDNTGAAYWLARSDHEAGGIPAGIASEFQHLPKLDDVISPMNRCLIRVTREMIKASHKLRPEATHDHLWHRVRTRALQDSMRLFRGHDSIVCNRLHAVILGLMFGLEVTAYDNCYGKLSRYIHTWLSDVPTLHFHR